ncbi:MAG TPA: sugar ABC transporter permease [Aggregatilineales bacterium]|nr:sugar ABC transporter permease [Aggregatilineales bacterium]
MQAREDGQPGTPTLAQPERRNAMTLTSGLARRLNTWWQNSPKTTLLMPAVLVVLLLSIFPLIVSLGLAFYQVNFVKGGIQFKFVGTDNFGRLLSSDPTIGLYQREFLGRFGELSLIQWVILAAFVGVMLYMMYQYVTSRRRKTFGVILRTIAILFATALAYLVLTTLSEDGLPGSLVVTLIFVGASVTFEYMLGLGLALLVTQELPGKRFFRVLFLLPMMITPVGIGFLFRMLTDTLMGPLAPAWVALGLANFSWSSTGAGARIAVLIGNIWEWTPFMFIILLAALEGTSREQIEASLVDGANRFQLFRYIIFPAIMPASTTLLLIRMIEEFKIIDMPNILTGGGPGTATESVTLHAYTLWRTLDLGTSAALAYLLLVVVTFIAVVYVNSIRRRLLGDNVQ